MLSDPEFDQLCHYCELNIPPPGEQGTEVNKPHENGWALLSESALTRLMTSRAQNDLIGLNFQAAGIYQGFIPAIVQNASCLSLATMPLTAEYQRQSTVRADIENRLAVLTGMPVCTLIQDDLVSVLENLLLSLLPQTKSAGQRSKILISATVSPVLRNALRTRLKFSAVDLIVVDYDKHSGCLTTRQLQQFEDETIVALVSAWPNYFGLAEDFKALSNWAGNRGCMTISLCNPLWLSVPDLVVDLDECRPDFMLGDCQALGLRINQQGGSPSFLASPEVLNAGAMERLKNGASVHYLGILHAYLGITGSSGLADRIRYSHSLLTSLVQRLEQEPGVSLRFASSSINECVIHIAQIDLEKAFKILAGHNMVLGYRLQDDYPELENCLMIHCSDQHTPADVEKLVTKVALVVKNLSTAGCPVKPKF